MSSKILIDWMFLGLMTVCFGCAKHETIALREAMERRSSLYRQAIAAEQAGNLEESVRLFHKVLLEEPKSFSAHFQLATLLQDYKKDYIGAIHHFRAYLALRPDSDKSVVQKGKTAEEMAAVVKERISKAKESLAPQLLTELGDSVEAVSQAHLMRKNTQLASTIKTLEVERSTAMKNCEESEKKRKQLQGEVARLRKLLEQIKRESVVSSSSSVIRAEKLKAEQNAFESSETGTKRDAIRRLREEAESMGGGKSSRTELPKPEKSVRKSPRRNLPKPDAPVARPRKIDLPKQDEPVAKPRKIDYPKPDQPVQSTRRSGSLSQWMKESTTTDSSSAVADALRQSKEVDERAAKRLAERVVERETEEESRSPQENAQDTLKALLGDFKGKNKQEQKRRPMRVYVVQPGDTLYRIADKFYNDGNKWKKIFDANRTRIDPDARVRAGQQILIP